MKYKKIREDIFIVENFWSESQCDDFVQKSEGIGYEQATIETDKGAKVVKSIRNNNRVMYNDPNLAATLWTDIKQYAPKQIGLSVAVGLNELFRFYRYHPGQEFKRHIDQSYIRNDREASYYTFMIYLNSNYSGGETRFSEIVIEPKKGQVLIFLHSLEHEGSPVTSGVKYVLRTDVMYKLEEHHAQTNN
jgi:prolyl 4-hydroxylase